MRLPPPTEKGVADYQRLIDSLPEQATCVLGITLANMLSQYSQDEVCIATSTYMLQTITGVIISS